MVRRRPHWRRVEIIERAEAAVRDRIFHYVRLPNVPDWLRCGWIAYPSLEGTTHGQWSALCEWLCDCPVPRPEQ